MRLLFASFFATALLASTACGSDETPADDDDDDTTSSSSGSSSGRTGSSSGGGSSSGRSSSSGGSGGSSSGGAGSSSSSGGSSSGEPDAGPSWPGPSGTAIAAGTIAGTVNLTEELAAHGLASGAADGSFAVLYLSYPDDPVIAGGTYVEKHAKDGTLVWKKQLEFSPTSSFTNLAMDEDGNVYVAVNVAPASGLVLDDETIPNVRESEIATDVGDCDVVRLEAATGAKAWHGQVTLKAGLTLGGDVSVQCRGLAARDGQVVLTGVYPTKDIFYVQGGTTTSAVGNGSDGNGNYGASFAISLVAATGVKNTVTTLLNGSSASEWSIDGTAIATDGRALIHGQANGTSVKVGTTGSGDLAFAPGALAQRDEFFFPAAFLNLSAAPVTGKVRGGETLAPGVSEPLAFFPQVGALPDAAALFGVVLTTNAATTYRPVTAGAAVALAADRTYFVLTRAASDAAAGEGRALDLGASSNFPQHFLGTGEDGSVALVGLHDTAVAFGDACDTTTLGVAGGYLVSLGTTPLAGCKFAVPLPAGVYPSRVAFGGDGRLFVAGLYDRAITFRAGVTLPAPAGDVAPFFVSFVP